MLNYREMENNQKHEEMDWSYGICVNCSGCGTKLQSPGALVFSPPLRDKPQQVEKFHVCLQCWFKLKDFLNFSA